MSFHLYLSLATPLPVEPGVGVARKPDERPANEPAPERSPKKKEKK